MKIHRLIPALLLAVALPAGSAAAQTASTNLGCAWNCHSVRLPLGLAVAEVTDGGSYVTLEDGSIWEIRLSQRPVASSWRPGDFVRLKTIWAPADGFETLLAHGDTDRAGARLAGRGRPPASGLPN